MVLCTPRSNKRHDTRTRRPPRCAAGRAHAARRDEPRARDATTDEQEPTPSPRRTRQPSARRQYTVTACRAAPHSATTRAEIRYDTHRTHATGQSHLQSARHTHTCHEATHRAGHVAHIQHSVDSTPQNAPGCRRAMRCFVPATLTPWGAADPKLPHARTRAQPASPGYVHTHGHGNGGARALAPISGLAPSRRPFRGRGAPVLALIPDPSLPPSLRVDRWPLPDAPRRPVAPLPYGPRGTRLEPECTCAFCYPHAAAAATAPRSHGAIAPPPGPPKPHGTRARMYACTHVCLLVRPRTAAAASQPCAPRPGRASSSARARVRVDLLLLLLSPLAHARCLPVPYSRRKQPG
jgi:hypothetical protein